MKILTDKTETIHHGVYTVNNNPVVYFRTEYSDGSGCWAHNGKLIPTVEAKELEEEYQKLINKPVETESKDSTKFTSDEYHIICNAVAKCHGDRDEVFAINRKMNQLIDDSKLVTNEQLSKKDLTTLLHIFKEHRYVPNRTKLTTEEENKLLNKLEKLIV